MRWEAEEAGNEVPTFWPHRFGDADVDQADGPVPAELASGLAQGKSILQAVEQAKTMVTEAIANSLSLGKGHGPVNILGKLLL